MFDLNFTTGLVLNGYYVQRRERLFTDSETGRKRPSYYLMLMVPGSVGAAEIKITADDYDRLEDSLVSVGASVSVPVAVSAYRDKVYYRIEDGAEVDIVDLPERSARSAPAADKVVAAVKT